VVTAREKLGGFYGGTRYETGGSVTIRPNEHLLVSLEDSFNQVYLPGGRFDTNLLALRTSYNFSRRWLTDVFVQVNTEARLTASNARLRCLYRRTATFYLNL